MGGRHVASWKRASRGRRCLAERLMRRFGACFGIISVVLSWRCVHPHAKVNTGSAFWSLPEAVGWHSGGEWAAVGGRDVIGVHPFCQSRHTWKPVPKKHISRGKKKCLDPLQHPV